MAYQSRGRRQLAPSSHWKNGFKLARIPWITTVSLPPKVTPTAHMLPMVFREDVSPQTSTALLCYCLACDVKRTQCSLLFLVGRAQHSFQKHHWDSRLRWKTVWTFFKLTNKLTFTVLSYLWIEECPAQSPFKNQQLSFSASSGKHGHAEAV